jgi:hypothetical protein
MLRYPATDPSFHDDIVDLPTDIAPARRKRCRRVDRVGAPASRGRADAAYRVWMLRAASIAAVLVESERVPPKPTVARLAWMERPDAWDRCGWPTHMTK